MKIVCLIIFVLFQAGCASIFGWDIHAPGILSESFYQSVKPLPNRIGLYLDPSLLTYQSKDRGGRTADPQIYHVGEAYGPMLLEGFQTAFEEFAPDGQWRFRMPLSTVEGRWSAPEPDGTIAIQLIVPGNEMPPGNLRWMNGVLSAWDEKEGVAYHYRRIR